MQLQRRLMLAMLLLLGLAAFAGVTTIFVQNAEFVGRIAGTLACAAAAMGCSLPLSKKLENEDSRPVGLVGLAATVIGFCLALAAIWAGTVVSTHEERLPLTAFAYALAAPPGVALYALGRRPLGRASGFAGIGLAGAAFILAVCAIWNFLPWANADEHAGETVGLLAVAAFPLCASLYGATAERPGLRLRYIGVAATISAVAVGVADIWHHSEGEEPLWLVQTFVIAYVFGGCNVLARLRLPDAQQWVVYGVIGVLVADGVLASMYNAYNPGLREPSEFDLNERLLTAGTIVLVCGVLAIAVLVAFNRRAPITHSKELSDIKSVQLVCPRCARKQDAAIGGSRCPGCGLLFQLQVIEPRCAKCNYPLLDLQSPVCPECGEPVGCAAVRGDKCCIGLVGRPVPRSR